MERALGPIGSRRAWDIAIHAGSRRYAGCTTGAVYYVLAPQYSACEHANMRTSKH
jgi:hypothetical protein